MLRPVAEGGDPARWVLSGWPAADLTPAALHVWRADLERPADLASLSSAERERAGRYRADEHRQRWSRSRALLRGLLGAYLEREPGEVDLVAAQNGKLEVDGAADVEFNLSHSGGIGLIALTLGIPVGVDIELARSVRDPLSTAERALGRSEVERLRSLPRADRDRQFLRSWVRYEAALKCVGDQLGGRPDLTRLHVIDLDPSPAAAAAVALTRAPVSIVLRELVPDTAGLPPAP
jgi:4'-phosphopantetheinyl transferase